MNTSELSGRHSVTSRSASKATDTKSDSKSRTSSGNKNGKLIRKPKRNKWLQDKRARNAKIRVKLPSIESYQKELEFPAEASGRVIVRLERLMGTDKIRITDPKYMSTLMERLEEEETEAWLKRTKARKQMEANRFRQLAIDGLMEPTPDMQDLYNHPVFRVNRILNRLSNLDYSHMYTAKSYPPITPTEPFAHKHRGLIRYVRNSTGHSGLGSQDSHSDISDAVFERGSQGLISSNSWAAATDYSGPGEVANSPTAQWVSSEQAHRNHHDDEDAEDQNQDDRSFSAEWGGEDYPEDSARAADTTSLASAELKFDVLVTDELKSKCSPYRSELVDLVYDENMATADEMYDTANQVLGAYKREQITADEFAVAEVNNYVAQFRDLLIHIGQSRDGPEMREKIRRLRRQCIESCRHAVNLLLQQVRSDSAEGLPVDFSPQLVLLFFCTQLLLRELRKCRRLVMTLPVDMTAYYAENRPGTSSLGGVLSQIILCRQLNPDFNAEELCSIDKDTVEISNLLDEMQEFMPKENTQTLALAGEDVFSKWTRRRRKKSMYRSFGSLCCVSKSGRFTV